MSFFFMYMVKIYCIYGESDHYIYSYIFIKLMVMSYLNYSYCWYYIYGWFLLHILWLHVAGLSISFEVEGL